MERAKQTHFVVYFDHDTNEFHIDEETTRAKFPDGNTWTWENKNDNGWNYPIDAEEQLLQDRLTAALDDWNNFFAEQNEPE